MFLCIVNLGFEFIKYQLKAKGRHGIHSPFIYEMVDKVLSKSLDLDTLNASLKIRSQLGRDFRTIEFKDFGAGSKKMSTLRSIRETYNQSATSLKYAGVLSRLCSYYKPMKILELGTSLGIGTLHLHWGNPKAIIDTVDASKEVQEIAKEIISKSNNGKQKINFHNLIFKEFLKNNLDTKYDFIFLDGHHDGTATLNYVETLESKMTNESILIIDDIRWSNDMFQAWNTLVQSEKFHVSIDLFRMGILIPRFDQRKEHFILRC